MMFRKTRTHAKQHLHPEILRTGWMRGLSVGGGFGVELFHAGVVEVSLLARLTVFSICVFFVNTCFAETLHPTE